MESPNPSNPMMDAMDTLGQSLEGLSVKQKKNARRRARLRAAKDAQRMASGEQNHQHTNSISESLSKGLTQATGELMWPAGSPQSASATVEAFRLPYNHLPTVAGTGNTRNEAYFRTQPVSATTYGQGDSNHGPSLLTENFAGPTSSVPTQPQGRTRSNQVRESVTLFQMLPPWRIDKWHRYDCIPVYQALPIEPLGQAVRAFPASVPGTPVSYDADGSPKQAFASRDQVTRALHNRSPPPESSYNLRSSRKWTSQAQGLKRHLSSEQTLHVSSKIQYSTPKFSNQKPLPAPTPTLEYRSIASLPCRIASRPHHLLLILDLNGTLIYRRRASSTYAPRPSLQNFLEYCLANHSVLIWSSATPSNVAAVCSKLFSPEQRQKLLGVWGRDTLDLTKDQYISKTQVYKRLERVWDGFALRHSHPNADIGERWSQANTLLLDDSVVKAQGQPFNLVQVPEFTSAGQQEKGQDVLGQVKAYLEKARMYENVSAFVRNERFALEARPGLDPQGHKTGGDIIDDGTEDGGVRVEG